MELIAEIYRDGGALIIADGDGPAAEITRYVERPMPSATDEFEGAGQNPWRYRGANAGRVGEHGPKAFRQTKTGRLTGQWRSVLVR